MDKDNTRNTLTFVIAAMAILMLYQFFVLGPITAKREAEAKQRAALAAQHPVLAAAPGASIFATRAQAVAASPRVNIDTPALKGSLSLKGGRIDDLFLKAYPETLAKDSPPVEMFRPEGAKQAYFADFGWITPVGPATDAATLWATKESGPLGPGHPVTLTYDSPQGLSFTRTISVDEHFVFTVVNTVTNKGVAAVRLAPYASVQRQGMPQLTPVNIIHEGAIGVLGDGKQELKLLAFKDWKKKGQDTAASVGGWLGVTDKYWLAAIIPDQKEKVATAFRTTPINGVDVYEAEYTGDARTLAPGASASETSRLFAGAKKVSVLQDYAKTLGVPRFEDAVDWGNFWILTKPLFWLLDQLNKVIGNFGLSILAMTVIVKAFLFPLANRSFASMSKMKKLQPEVDAIKARIPDDPAKVQQETMALWQREKINPLAGCLPILVQIPVFYALYKVLYVTLEMRHAPFFGWIKDLSAPDPTSWLNLFGLIPWNPGATPLIGGILGGVLAIGVWPMLYGLGQWVTTQMSPQPNADPTQKIMFQVMPLMFTVMMAHSPAGLLIYWTWSSVLTIIQQYVIMHRYGADNVIDDVLNKLRGKTAAAA